VHPDAQLEKRAGVASPAAMGFILGEFAGRDNLDWKVRKNGEMNQSWRMEK
jgi:hypothetical protein